MPYVSTLVRALTIAALTAVLICSCSRNDTETTVVNQPDTAATAADCEEEFLRLLSPLMRDIEASPYVNSPFPIRMQEELASLGFSDPETQILADLKEHPELIPYPGVHGGAMRFWNGKVICPDRVLAYFEDGHYGGWALLGFQVVGPDSIDWRIVYATADGHDPVKPQGW